MVGAGAQYFVSELLTDAIHLQRLQEQTSHAPGRPTVRLALLTSCLLMLDFIAFIKPNLLSLGKDPFLGRMISFRFA